MYEGGGMTALIGVIGSVCGGCALLATIPGTLELLLATISPDRKAGPVGGAQTEGFRLAVVVPAHNEAALIGRCVRSLAAAIAAARRASECCVVVVADNCTDSTGARATEAGARVLVRENTSLRGKGYALRHAFDRLQPEGFDGFLVVDADSVVSLNLIGEAARHLKTGSPAIQCRYRVLNSEATVRTRLMDLSFLAFNVLRPRGRSGWGLSCGILGNGFGLRRETLEKIPWDASSIVEDLEYHLRLVTAGERVDFIDDATVFGEIPSDSGAAKVQRSRWEGGRLRMVREWVPAMVAWVMRGDWRMTEPLLDLLTFPLAYHVVLLMVAVVALPDSLRPLAAISLLTVAIYVLRACLLGGHPLKTAGALTAAPFYVLWKITTLGAVFAASRRGANWIRSGRENEGGLPSARNG
jgi:cellulose synthase/poly-beta-1,6-N-acetylglucosamine synthase-like glycosyltransferase